MLLTRFSDIGTMEYRKAWDYQESLLAELLSSREKPGEKIGGHLLFCEHPHVYTLGKYGSAGNMLVTQPRLKELGADFVQTNRGGDITYHGPGQLVGYPVLDLVAAGIGIKKYVNGIEESIISTLKEYGLKGERMSGATGVWMDSGIQGKARKICALGIRSSRGISMHGFAFNISTDLRYFSHINPCGFTTLGVTSLTNELGYSPDYTEVKNRVRKHLAENLDLKYLPEP